MKKIPFSFPVFYHVVMEQHLIRNRCVTIQELFDDPTINDSLSSKYRNGIVAVPKGRIADVDPATLESRLRAVIKAPGEGASHLRSLMEGVSFQVTRNREVISYEAGLILDEITRREGIRLYDPEDPFPFLSIMLRDSILKNQGKPCRLTKEDLKFLYNLPKYCKHAHAAKTQNRKKFENTRAKAERGDVKAMYDLALQYFFGTGSRNGRDFHEAFKWLEKVLAEDSAYSDHARVLMSKLYYYGEVPGQKQSFRKSFELRRSIDQQKHPDLYYNELLFMIIDGVGCNFSPDKIREFIEDHSVHLFNSTKLALAKYYLRLGNHSEAIALLEDIQENHPEAQYLLGNLYYSGVHNTPPRPDPYKAMDCFYNAAESGFTDALYMIGKINFRGSFGYKQNLDRARECFLAGARARHQGSQYHYAWMCRHGLGGERDLGEALKYFVTGAEQGNLLCMEELATLYQEPALQDYQAAFMWAGKGAKGGNAICEFLLGTFYYEGKGCSPDMDKAVLHLRSALNMGVFEAGEMLELIEENPSI